MSHFNNFKCDISYVNYFDSIVKTNQSTEDSKSFERFKSYKILAVQACDCYREKRLQVSLI